MNLSAREFDTYYICGMAVGGASMAGAIASSIYEPCTLAVGLVGGVVAMIYAWMIERR